MTPKQLALAALISASVITVSIGGVKVYRDLYTFTGAKGDGIDAGFGACPLRLARFVAAQTDGRVKTFEEKARVCGQDIIACYHWNADGTCQPPPRGWSVLRIQDLGAATGQESDPVEVNADCMCSSGANCTATSPTGVVGTTLPKWVIAGPEYQWTAPVGSGCVPVPCIETTAGAEWPAGCPKQ